MENETEEPSDIAAVERCQQAYNRVRDELAKVIIGQSDVIEQVLIAMFARGHALLEGVPAWPRHCSLARWPARSI